MNNLNLFQYQGQQVRTVLVDGEPNFVANDICAVLDLTDPRKSVNLLDEDERNTVPVTDNLGREQQTFVVTEAGMYSLVLRSRKPEAKAFKRWITHEVLPQIRKTGTYGVAPVVPIRELSLEEKTLEVLGALSSKVEEQRQQLAIAAPKAEAFDAFLSTSGDYSINEAAKILTRDHQIVTGEGRLRTQLEEWGWIYRDKGKPRAKQYQIDRGRMAEKAQWHFHPSTGEKINDTPQVRVTAKGLDAIRSKWMEAAA